MEKEQTKQKQSKQDGKQMVKSKNGIFSMFKIVVPLLLLLFPENHAFGKSTGKEVVLEPYKLIGLGNVRRSKSRKSRSIIDYKRNLLISARANNVAILNYDGSGIKQFSTGSEDLNDVGYASEAQLLAAVTYNSVRLWNTKTGKEIWTGKTKQDRIVYYGVSLSKKGDLLAIYGSHQTIRLYSIKKGVVTPVFDKSFAGKLHPESVVFRFSKDGKSIVFKITTESPDKTEIFRFDIKSKELETLMTVEREQHRGDLIFDDSSRYLLIRVSGGYWVYDMEKYEKTASIYHDTIAHLQYFVSDDILRLWNKKNNKLLYKTTLNETKYKDVTRSKKGKKALKKVLQFDRAIMDKIYRDYLIKKESKLDWGVFAKYKDMDTHADASQLIAISPGGIHVLNPLSGNPERVIEDGLKEKEQLEEAKFCNAGKYVCAITNHQNLIVWDYKTGLEVFRNSFDAELSMIFPSKGSDKLMIKARNGDYTLYSLSPITKITDKIGGSYGYTSRQYGWTNQFSNDGKSFAIGKDNRLKVVKTEELREEKKFYLNQWVPGENRMNRIQVLRYSPNDAWLGISAWDNIFYLLDTKKNKIVNEANEERSGTANVEEIIFTEDSSHVIVGPGTAGTINMYTIPDLKKVVSIPSKGNVEGMVYHPDKNLLFVLGVRELYVWNLNTRKLQQTLEVGRGGKVALSKKQNLLYVLTNDSNIKVFKIKTP